jgi:type III secretion system TyeA family effector delivery regulator
MIRPFRNNPQKLAAFIRERQSPASRPDEDRKQLQQEIRDALRDLELTHGGLIRSNLDAESSAAKSADANKFLDGYTEVLYASTGFADASKKLLARFGLNELPATVGLMKEALESMKKALDSTKVELGDDLRQPIPDSVHLAATLSALSHMHVLTTLIETTEKFVKSMEGVAKAAGIASAPLDASVLLNGLVEIVDTAWIAPGQFERLLKDLGVKEEPATIVTLQGVARMLRELPDKVYRDNNARTAILTAAQDALDTAIDREEALDEARPSEPAP